jgi:hypothetical protein
MTDQPLIEVVVQLEQQDLSRANKDVSLDRLTPSRWVLFAVSSAFLTAMVTVLAFHQITQPHLIAVAFVGLVGGPIALIAAIHWSARRAARSLVKNTPSLKGPTHWLFSDSGIRVDSPTTNAHIEWKTYVRVRETPMQFLFYPQSQIAYVVPKRCFSSNDQITKLREMIRRCAAKSTLQP